MASKFWNEKDPGWFRTLSTVIALVIWTILFLAFMAPFFY